MNKGQDCLCADRECTCHCTQEEIIVIIYLSAFVGCYRFIVNLLDNKPILKMSFRNNILKDWP